MARKFNTKEEIVGWVDEVSEAVKEVGRQKEEAHEALDTLEDAVHALKFLLREVPRGASEADCWESIEEMSTLDVRDAKELTSDDVELFDEDRSALVRFSILPVVVSAGMTGADLAQYVTSKGGCNGSVKFAESCDDLREAWETCNEPGWLLTWADWHQMEGYSEALAEQYSYEAYHASLEGFGSQAVPMQKVIAQAACIRIREKLGDDPLSWLPGQSCNSIVAAEIRLAREAMLERSRAAQEVAPCGS